MNKLCLLLSSLLLLFLFSCKQEKPAIIAKDIEPTVKKENPTEVKVAAVQCYSRMGEIQYNRKILTRHIRTSAKAGAKIIVLPEAAVTGYMDPGNDVS